MPMTAIDLFHDHQRNLTARRLEVEKQAEKLHRQASFFREQLEVMESLGNTDQANNCRQALGDLEGAIEKNEEAMAELDSTRYAEEAMSEILMKRRKLEAEIQDLYQFAVDAQVNFLDKLTKMGELVRESENLQHASMPIAKVLRQNPVAKLWVGNPMQFEISGSKVRELLRV
jgi:hypothetical protein